MLCKHCNNQIPDDANYCSYCGNTPKQSNGVSSAILFTFIIIYFSISLIVFLFDKFEPDFFTLLAQKMICYLLILVRLTSFILIPFAFKRMKYRLIALGIMAPALILTIYNTIYVMYNIYICLNNNV